MSNRHFPVKRVPTNQGEGHFIEVYVSYNKGGMSMATYKQIPRGYSVHVQPVEIKDMGGYTSKSFIGFSGYRQDVEEANRFSQKKLREVAERMKDSDLVQQMIDLVCEKQGIEVIEPVEA